MRLRELCIAPVNKVILAILQCGHIESFNSEETWGRGFTTQLGNFSTTGTGVKEKEKKREKERERERERVKRVLCSKAK